MEKVRVALKFKAPRYSERAVPTLHAIRQLDYQIAGGKVVKRPLGSMKVNDNLPLLIFIVPE